MKIRLCQGFGGQVRRAPPRGDARAAIAPRCRPVAAAGRLKFGNQPTIIDGIRFASKLEARRYGELKLLERARKINHLTWQDRHKLTVNGVTICTYVSDFEYQELPSVKWVVEDCKGYQTRESRLKLALFKALYPSADVRIILA